MKKLSGPSGSLRVLVAGFAADMKTRGYSVHTIESRIWSLLWFVDFAEERNVIRPADVSPSHVERFAKYLANYKRPRTGKNITRASQITFLSAVREYFRYLYRKGVILSNPASDIELPKQNRHLPRQIFSAEEVERLMNVPDVETKNGLRDRAILELLYSTGMRRAETANLKISDIDFTRGVIFIRDGKGRKDRVIPVGSRALFWTEKYIRESRPTFVNSRAPETEHLFLGRWGMVLPPPRISDVVRNCRKAAGISKEGAAHIFRHTTATLMLENGADVRHVQELLGHESLDTTKIYTKVAITKLKEVHERTHPGNRKRDAAQERMTGAGESRRDDSREAEGRGVDSQEVER